VIESKKNRRDSTAPVSTLLSGRAGRPDFSGLQSDKLEIVILKK